MGFFSNGVSWNSKENDKELGTLIFILKFVVCINYAFACSHCNLYLCTDVLGLSVVVCTVPWIHVFIAFACNTRSVFWQCGGAIDPGGSGSMNGRIYTLFFSHMAALNSNLFTKFYLYWVHHYIQWASAMWPNGHKY